MTRRQLSDVVTLLGCQTILALLLVWPFLGGWLLMLAIGVVHHEWPAVPPFGYWSCVALVGLVSLSRVPAALVKGITDGMKR